jgi:hypothetical protein
MCDTASGIGLAAPALALLEIEHLLVCACFMICAATNTTTAFL